MKRQDLIALEKMIAEEVVTRRKLGGYSQDAGGILLIAEILMRLLQHTIDEYQDEEELTNRILKIAGHIPSALAIKKKTK